LTLYQIDLPGLHTDEAMEVLPAMQLLRGQTVECYRDVCVELFGLRFPVMIYEYIAAVNAYLALPFFAAFGVNVTALRLMPIVQSAAAMVFVYLFAREFSNRRVATVALLLLAVNPSFVFWSRQGVFVTSVTIPLSMAGMWALWRWRQHGRASYLYLGAFLFGLGTSAKLLSWWVIAGVGLSVILLNLDRLLECWRNRKACPLASLQIRLRWRDLVIAGLLFVLGLLPLIVFNVKTGSTIYYVRNNLFAPSYYNVDNAAVGENLRERIKELGSVINGETFFYLGGKPYASWRYTTVFLLAVGVLSFSMLIVQPLMHQPLTVQPLGPDTSHGSDQSRALPAWIAIAATVLPSYLVLRFINVRVEGWYCLTLALAIPAAALAIVVDTARTRQTRWRVWLRYALGALCAASLFTLFVYLSWKLARWKAQWLYVMGVGALLLAPWLRARSEARKALFPALVLAIALMASAFTPTGLLFTHLAILVPWPILVVSVTADLVARRSGLDRVSLARTREWRNRSWAAASSLGTVVILALTGMLIYDDLRVDTAYHRDLRRIGGVGDHTSASYTLVRYLETEGISDVVAMDWGIQDVVQFLSEGQINPPQLSSYEDIDREDGAFALRVREHLNNPDTVYVFHVGAVFKNRWEAFQHIAEQEGRAPVEIKVVHDRAAIPIFRLVRVP
jgi:4-amino-4-deoxy-L-arabinose transferase-like glycosyltransferase